MQKSPNDDYAEQARNWLVDIALPFWGAIGFDDKSGGFHERCGFDGIPIQSAPRRLMVQARQIFVFSYAHVLGWHPNALELAARGVDHILRHYRRADGRPGFVFSLTPSGAVADSRRNTYGHAFVLLALSWFAKASGAQALRAVRQQCLRHGRVLRRRDAAGGHKVKRLAIALAVLPGLIVAGGAKAESCTKSRDFILTNSTDLPQKPQVYRKLYQNCLDTLSLSNVEDAFVLTSGAIAVLPRHDTISATAGTLAQFCEHFPSGNLQFIPTRNRSQAANISLVVKMSSAHPTSCQQIKGGG